MSRRRHQGLGFRIGVEHAISLAALCLLLLWVLSGAVGSAGVSAANCADAYRRARTAADTLAVDDRSAGGRGLSATCGGMRRDGTLGR